MRLLNTTPPLRTREFNESELPAYAILSHTWQDEEILFSDLPLLANSVNANPAHAKVLAFCARARAQGYQYAWMDTCCIDKTSTTELSEAINSMYRWYQNAGICLAYLSDFEPLGSQLNNCRWFKRGWTLQELIAPRDIEFYDRRWNLLGTKSQLMSQLSTITGIKRSVLAGASPETCSIAERMFWAAGRETTRKEDRAYSLLGLFDVNLPLIYGASDTRNAFILLQEEIIKHSDDQTIFVWGQGFSELGRGHCGLLASSPDAFANCQGIVRSPSSGLNPRGFSLTNVGLTLTVKVHQWGMNIYAATFDCMIEDLPNHRCGVLLEMLADGSQYARVRCEGLTNVMTSLDSLEEEETRLICVQQKPGIAENQRYGFWIRTLRPPGFTEEELYQAQILSQVSPLDYPSEGQFVEIPQGRSGTACIVYLPWRNRQQTWRKIQWFKVAFDADFNPVCIIGNMNRMWGGTAFHLASSHHILTSYPSSVLGYIRSRLFHSRWWEEKSIYRNMIEYGKPSTVLAPESSFRDDGYCVIEGRRNRNLNVNIYPLKLNVSMQLEYCSAPLHDLGMYPGSTWRIWTIDIAEITAYNEDVPNRNRSAYESAKKSFAKLEKPSKSWKSRLGLSTSTTSRK